MTDFNKIRYHAVIAFLTPENVPNDCCIWWMCTVICHGQVQGSRVSSRQKHSRQKQPLRWAPVGTSVWSCLWRNCHAVENTVLQNHRVNVQLIADAVGISIGSVKTVLRTPVDAESLCTLGAANAWPENEGLSMWIIKWKFEAHAVGLEFVCEAHCNRWWDLDIPLRSRV